MKVELEKEAEQLCLSLEQSRQRRWHMRWMAPLAALAAVGGSWVIHRRSISRGFQIQSAGLVGIAALNLWKETPENGFRSYVEHVKDEMDKDHEVKDWTYMCQLPELWEKCGKPEEIPLYSGEKNAWKLPSKIFLGVTAAVGIGWFIWLGSKRSPRLALSVGSGAALTSFIAYLAIGNERQRVASRLEREKKISGRWWFKRRVTGMDKLNDKAEELTVDQVDRDLSSYPCLRKINARRMSKYLTTCQLRELTLPTLEKTDDLLRFLTKLRLTDPQEGFWEFLKQLPVIETVTVAHTKCFPRMDSLNWLSEVSSLKKLVIEKGFKEMPARDTATLEGIGFTAITVKGKEIDFGKAAAEDDVILRRTRPIKLL